MAIQPVTERRPGRLASFLSRPVGTIEAPDVVKRAGPYLLSLFLLVVGASWSLLVPPSSVASPIYLVAAIGWAVLTWWWSGTELPRKVKRQHPLKGNYLVLLVGLAVSFALGLAFGMMRDLVSAFAWSFFSGALKLTFTSLTMKLQLCPRCKSTRWTVKYRAAWYCSRCGLKIQRVGVSREDATPRDDGNQGR